MVVSILTSSEYCDIGENHLNWTHFRPNSKLLQKQSEFIDVFTSDGVSRRIFASLGLEGFTSRDLEYYKEMVY